MNFKLTKEEKSAIAALKRLEKKWPESLWLFATGNSINIMRYKENGERAVIDGYGGMDPDYVVDTVSILNDGGDW